MPASAARPNRTRRRRASPPPTRGRAWLVACYTLRSADSLASAMVVYAVPLMVLHITGSPAWTGLAFFAEWLPRLAAVTGAGPLIDRYTPAAAAATSGALRAATTAAAILGLALGGGIAVVLAYAILTGVLAEGSYLASEALAAEASRRAGHRAHRVQAVMTGIDQTAQLVGPALGAVLLLAGPVALLASIAVLSAVVCTEALLVRSDRPHLQLVTDPPPRLLTSLATGAGVVRRTPALAWLLGALMVGNLVSGAIEVATPVLVRSWGYPPSASGVIWSSSAALALVVIGVSRRGVDRFGLFPVGLVAAALMCLSAAAAALAPTLWAYGAAVAVMMGAEGAVSVVLRTARARLIPERHFGSALAVTALLVRLPLPLAGVLVAAVPTHLAALLVALAAAQAAAIGTCFTGLHRHRAAYEAQGDQADPEPVEQQQAA
ncbi:MFS transporter [Streptacidiphilus neutrinimicus]|uniref:MFS transporter n=1 Tax=Streptacidiphilus neutrinimicus TaxID=105420 RepID=UPI0007C7829F